MNHIICVIDRSGSMDLIKNEAIGGFNSFLEQQKADGTDDVLTFVQFDNEYEPVFVRRPLERVRPLTKKTFCPRGMTALNDAIGKTIQDTAEWCRDTDNVILMILTDGHENASQEFTTATIKRLVEEHERKYGWNVVYVGPEIDAFDTARGYGVSHANTVGYPVTGQGITDAYTHSADTVSRNKE